jgi:hypothetical protein
VLRDFVQDHRILVVGDRQEAAELGFGVVDEDREENLALVDGDDRLVVRDELGEQAEQEQAEEHPQAPIAAPVGLEVAPAALVERRQREAAEVAERQHVPADLLRGQRLRRLVRHQRLLHGLVLETRVQGHTSRVSKSMRGSTSV